jgi:hypothetical protein
MRSLVAVVIKNIFWLPCCPCRTCQDALLKFASAVGWGVMVQHDAKGMFPEVRGRRGPVAAAAAAAVFLVAMHRLLWAGA